MKKRVLFLVNHEIVIYNFRKEIIERLLSENYEVFISSPSGDKINELIAMGCKHVEVNFERHGTDFINELKLIRHYRNIFKNINPDIILGFTIKPNIYGALAAKRAKIPFVANITGLGTALENDSHLKNILIKLYRYSLTDVQKIFFQNSKNINFFEKNKISPNVHELLPGSGVNIDKFNVLDYPDDGEINFVFISRIMEDKGINEYLEAAKYIKNNYENVNFHICGFTEEDYEETLTELHNNGTIIYHGMIDNIQEVLMDMHCIVHPSYHEGMSNVLLEAASSGRPIIASDIPGCRETFVEGISGFSFPKQYTEGLIQAIEKFIQLDNNTRKQMGLSGRKKMEKEFDRQIVVEKYLKEIKSI